MNIDGNCFPPYSYQYKEFVLIGTDTIWSNTIPGPTFDSTGAKVNFDANYNNSSIVGSYVSVAEYCGPDWISQSQNIGPKVFFLQYSTVKNPYAVMRVAPFYVSSLSAGYHDWTTNAPATLYQNFNLFTVNSSLTPVTGNYIAKVGATVRDSLIDASNSVVDSIQFSDPWLVDSTDQRYKDNTYGYHNLATDAPFRTESSPLNLTLTSKYKGLFKGQTIISGKPYYATRAPLVKIINGYIAFFAGWVATNATLSDGGPNSNGYDSTAFVDTAANAVVTAKYSYYTVSANRTIPSGTWTMAGALTVASGVTLTVSSGATLQFPSGTALTVNGVLSASSATFTFTSASPYTSGIIIKANGSSLTGCTISGADRPLYFKGVTSATISGGTINNSNFSSSQAIRICGSTPTITGITITGGPSSSNGVRYDSASGGTLETSEINYLGGGTAVIVQGGSSPTISENSFYNNYYNGIYAINNGSPTIHVTGNSVQYNSTPGGNNYSNGIVSTNSYEIATGNIVQDVSWGFVAYNSGTITAGNMASASNTATQCNDGMVIYNGSMIYFGTYIQRPPGSFTQACNNFYGNILYNAVAEVNSGVWAEGDWWGVQGQAVLVYYDGSSWVEDLYPLNGMGQCYGSGPMQAGTGTDTSLTPSVLTLASQALATNDTASAIQLYIKAVSAGTINQRQSAFAELYLVLRDSKNPNIDQIIESCGLTATDLKDLANDLLLKSYIVKGRFEDAKTLSASIISQYPGKVQERDALIQLSSLMAFDPKYTDVSMDAVLQLKAKFAPSVEPAFFAAFGVSTAPIAISQRKKMETETIADTIETFGLASYPNPFNPSTQLQYQIQRGGYVSLKVYDILGREVASLVHEMKNAGKYTVSWNAARLASGIYYARLESSGRVAIQKLLFMK